MFWNLRQSASQNLSEKNIAVLTAPSFWKGFVRLTGAIPKQSNSTAPPWLNLRRKPELNLLPLELDFLYGHIHHLHVRPHQPLPGILLEEALQERPEKKKEKEGMIKHSAMQQELRNCIPTANLSESFTTTSISLILDCVQNNYIVISITKRQ